MNNQLIERDLLQSIKKAFRYFSVLTLTGPRQSGKTTLCRKLFVELPYYNLEDAATLAAMQQDPKAFLNKHREGMVIDEAQRFPEVFSYLQVQVDERFLNGVNSVLPEAIIVQGHNSFADLYLRNLFFRVRSEYHLASDGLAIYLCLNQVSSFGQLSSVDGKVVLYTRFERGGLLCTDNLPVDATEV